MAKTIKFNLICDEQPIRTIGDLQNHFSVEDIISYYNNKLLHRWLQVRGYNKELEEVSSISDTDPLEVIRRLVRIFDIETDTKKIEESIYILKFAEERKKLFKAYQTKVFDVEKIIKDYENSYINHVNSILSNPNDMAVIKAVIEEMLVHYEWIFQLNHKELFYSFYEKSPLTIMCFLMNNKSRKYFLPIKKVKEDGTFLLDTTENRSKLTMYNDICRLIKGSNFPAALGDNLISFSGITDGYWKDLEPKGKQYMIISMEDGDYVRPSGVSGGDLSQADILNKFMILDGVDYKSNFKTHALRYMEV